MIKQLRRDAREFLGVRDYQTMPLSRIYDKLQRCPEFQKKRSLKQILKENKGDLQSELRGIEEQLSGFIKPGMVSELQLKDALTQKIG